MTDTYLFAKVAHAIEATEAQLRNWMKRSQIDFEETGKPGWRRFTKTDVARLTFIRLLVEHGVPVEEANAITAGRLAGLVLKDYATRDDALVWWISDISSPHFTGCIVENARTKRHWEFLAATNQHDDGMPLGIVLIGPVLDRAYARLEYMEVK